MRIKNRMSWLAAAALFVAAAFVIPEHSAAQSMMDGYWAPLMHQDAYPYAGGPDPGDFSGLPITDAARTIAMQYSRGRV